MLFYWFLSNEINRNINEFNNYSIAKIKLIDVQPIQNKLNFSDKDLKFIEKTKSLINAS